MHSYLASSGVDGVKVDVQSMLELVGGGHGGRVEIARAYHTALEASVAKNFKENGVIACMSHSTDGIYMYVAFHLLHLGAAWCKDSRKYKFHDSESKELAGTICAADIEGLEQLTGPDWEGDVAIYSHNSGELVDLPLGASLVTMLKRLEFEIFTVSPIQTKLVWGPSFPGSSCSSDESTVFTACQPAICRNHPVTSHAPAAFPPAAGEVSISGCAEAEEAQGSQEAEEEGTAEKEVDSVAGRKR
ncbi:unnamed protein product [Closterium sp. NIES-64]|nr:unnamed protein product [Closterium sp. NIES-64]